MTAFCIKEGTDPNATFEGCSIHVWNFIHMRVQQAATSNITIL